MSFINIINNFNNNFVDYDKNVSIIKKNPHIKNMSKYIKGGISKLLKNDLHKLLTNIKNYKIGYKTIVPDNEQLLIVNAPNEYNIRVVAGAGTGKTTTIICRIKYLLDVCTTPDKILVLTFNVESRQNLENMINNIIGFNINIEIRTIDSFCFRLIKNYGDSNIISRSEYGSYGKNIMEKYGSIISQNYKYIFFDEFQDINSVQFAILKIFTLNNCYLTVIGDDSQNIYQFRGSDNYYIINYDKLITNTLTYKITTNYRSVKQIVDLANMSIDNNNDKIHKIMTSIKNGGIIDINILDNTIDYIIQKIKKYNIDYHNICILSRNSLPLKLIETEFEKSKIPYVSLFNDILTTGEKSIIHPHKIVLSTIHCAKGLEWEIVFIVGLNDKHFPSHLNNGLVNIEEERRLFYVSVTRAKKNLHFVANTNEIPLSRFINEVECHIDCSNIDTQNIFNNNNDCYSQKTYSVTKIIEMMNSDIICDMRKNNIIPHIELETKILYDKPITYTDDIKNGCYQSDYGIYCDYYMTHQLMHLNKQHISDMHVLNVLHYLPLNIDELTIYHTHNIINHIIKNTTPLKMTNDIVLLINKIKKYIETTNVKPHNIDFIISLSNRDNDQYNYPKYFVNKLHNAYAIYTNYDDTIDKQKYIESIYYVSLCPKLNDKRRRLVYKNIQHIYDELSAHVLPRIDDYIKQLPKDIICKLQMNTQYKINDGNISLNGELDYIVNNTIVDIKCSENDFSIEWFIQLLLYYALYMSNKPQIAIDKLAIINIFSGKYYEIKIQNYNWSKLLNYVKILITNDIQGARYRIYDKIDLIYNIKNDDQITIPTKQIIHVNTCINKNGYMIMDIENNTINGDIIQFAYIVYNDNDVELKKYNAYVKNRIIDNRAKQITGITNDILMNKGIKFVDIIQDFVNDLINVRHICGHYIHTDIAKIKTNVEKYNITFNINILDNINIIDTYIMYKQIEDKHITLSELYFKLFNKKMVGAHNALTDVEYTSMCYAALRNKIENNNYLKD